jgi:hypothetical protein
MHVLEYPSALARPVSGQPAGFPIVLVGNQIADSARVRFLAKRVAGCAPITSLCAWLGLRVRGRNLRPVSRDIGTSLWADSRSPWGRTGYVRAGGRLISRKRVAGDGVNPVGMGLFASIPQAPTTRATPRRRLPGGFIRGRYEALMPVP